MGLSWRKWSSSFPVMSQDAHFMEWLVSSVMPLNSNLSEGVTGFVGNPWQTILCLLMLLASTFHVVRHEVVEFCIVSGCRSHAVACGSEWDFIRISYLLLIMNRHIREMGKIAHLLWYIMLVHSQLGGFTGEEMMHPHARPPFLWIGTVLFMTSAASFCVIAMLRNQ